MCGAVRAWFESPDRFRPGDSKPYPCGSVRPLDVAPSPFAKLLIAVRPGLRSSLLAKPR